MHLLLLQVTSSVTNDLLCSSSVKPITCPPHLIKHCPPSLQEEMLSSFDRWGDSYIDDVTPDTLRHQFSLMSTKEMKTMLPETRKHIVKRLVPLFIFRSRIKLNNLFKHFLKLNNIFQVSGGWLEACVRWVGHIV